MAALLCLLQSICRRLLHWQQLLQAVDTSQLRTNSTANLVTFSIDVHVIWQQHFSTNACLTTRIVRWCRLNADNAGISFELQESELRQRTTGTSSDKEYNSDSAESGSDLENEADEHDRLQEDRQKGGRKEGTAKASDLEVADNRSARMNEQGPDGDMPSGSIIRQVSTNHLNYFGRKAEKYRSTHQMVKGRESNCFAKERVGYRTYLLTYRHLAISPSCHLAILVFVCHTSSYFILHM